MTGTVTGAKVYYLPTAELAVTRPAPSPWRRLRRRVVRSWWRARLALASARLGLRRRPSREQRAAAYSAVFRSGGEDYAAVLGNVITEGPAEVIERPRRTPQSPAKIFDFEAARLRLRPAVN